MANSVTHAALPYPIKNARYSLVVPFRASTGIPTDPTTPDTEFSLDAGAFADTAEEITTLSGTATGTGYITLSGAETNGSILALAVKAASGPLTTLITVLPRVLATVATGTLTAGAAGGGTLTTTTYDITGCFIMSTGGTGGGGTGGANNQARKIATFTPATGAFTVVPNWETTPDATTTYTVLLPEGLTLGVLKTLNPTTAGNKLDVTSTGGAGLDWSNVENPTTTLALTGTTISTSQAVASVSGAAGSVTGAVGSVTGNVGGNVVGSVASVSGAVGSVTGAVGSVTGNVGGNVVGSVASVTGAVGSVTGNVGGNVVGSVGSVTGAVGSVTGNVGGNVVGSVASVTAAVSLTAAESGVIASGTAAAGGASTITLQTALGADALPVGCMIKITSGTGLGQARVITAYVNSTKVATVDRAWTTNPDNTSVYAVIFADAAATSSGQKITGVVLTDTATTVSGNVSGNVVGSVGSVTGAVGSVTGNVGGNVVGSVASVTGAVGSVTGNVGGNVVGSVASVSGAVGSVTGNVGGNLVGNVNGNVVGSVASVAGAVGSVTGNLGGNVNGNVVGSVGSVVGAVGSVAGAVGSVTGAVGSVTGGVGGSVAGNVGGKVLGGGAGTITGDGVQASSVTGAVGSVTGAVGSVSGAVGSVSGNVGGDVAGKVLGGGASALSGDGVRAASVTGAVGSVTGSVGSVTGNVGGNVTGSVGSVAGAVGSVTGNVGGNVVGSVGSVAGAVGSVTGNIGGNLLGTISAAALAALADAVWDELLAGHTTAGSAGKTLSDAGTGGIDLQSLRDAMAKALTGGTAIESGSLDALLLSLRARRVAAPSGILQNGEHITLVQGDDFTAASGQPLDWTDDDGVWPDLTGATVTLSVRQKDASGDAGAEGTLVLTVAMTVLVATGTGKAVRAQITAEQTAALEDLVRGYRFAVKAVLADTSVVTLVRGDVSVLEDES